VRSGALKARGAARCPEGEAGVFLPGGELPAVRHTNTTGKDRPSMKQIEIGTALTKECVVTEEMLAKSVGSGDVSVLATPMMMALMEGAAAELLAAFLEEGETSVGTEISSSHVAATPAGMKITASATVTAAQGRQVSFSLRAEDEAGLIGEGVHQRVVVYRDRFQQKAQAKLCRE